MKARNRWIAAGLLVVGLVLVNIIGIYIPWRADWTSSGIYTISEGSKKLINQITEPVTLRLYFSRGVQGVPTFFKNYGTQVEELLRQYAAASGGRITLQVIDPKPDTKEEEAAIRAGIQPSPLPSGESLFFGLLAMQADREKAIPFFTPQREAFLEFDISQLLYQVQQAKKPKLGIITQLPMFGQPAYMPGQRSQGDWIFLQELRNNFEVQRVEGDSLPQDLDVLAVLHPPATLSDKMKYAIDQFLLGGKPVLVAVDPSSYLSRASQNPQMMMMGGRNTSSNLPGLLDKWGIEFSPETLVGDVKLATAVSVGPDQAPVRNPTWLSVTDFTQDSPATSQLNQMLFVEAGSIKLAPNSKLELTPLVTASPDSGTVPASSAQFGSPVELLRQLTPNQPQAVLAALIRGEFPTAFPNGEPGAGEEGNAEKAKTDPGSMKSSGTSSLVVVADTDFLADDFSVRVMNFLGMRTLTPLNDNLPFISNVVDMLAGSQDLISLRGKGSARRPFTRVRDLEMAAERKYQQRLDQLESQLQDVQNQLQQMMGKQQDQRQLVASPEIQKAIEKFRLKEVELRSERREIRKKLREDIESLNISLAVFNLVTMPLVVAVAGIVILGKRAQRRRK